MPGTVVAHHESTAPDGVLVQEAAAGSGVSYGELYDRYATQVYNYCLRVTGSPEDAADATQEAFTSVLRRLHQDDRPVLEFSSYLFAAARNESYALMRRRTRVTPSDTVPEDPRGAGDVATEPERAVLRRDAQDAVRQANATLPPRHREVLALRELGDHSYDEIGRIMGISENGAAQLIWRARSKLREAMTAGAVASVVANSPDCERAQVLLTRIQDGETVDELERFWLDQHLDECGSCRSAKGMLLEVGAFYCAWVPIAAGLALKADTLTAAGGVIGADWSGVAAGTAGGSASGGSGGGAGGTSSGAGGAGGAGGVGAGGAVAGVAALAAIGIALSGVLADDSKLERSITPPKKEPAAAQAPDRVAGQAAKSSSAQGAPLAGGLLPGDGSPLTALRRASTRTGNGPVAGPQPNGLLPRSEPRDDGAPAPRDGGPAPRDRDEGTPRDRDEPGPRGGGPEPNSPTAPGPPRPDGGPPSDGSPRSDPPPRGGPPTGDGTPRQDPPGDTKPPPDPQDPPVDTNPPPDPPPPPRPEGCSWPGQGNGPGHCPPGHGGDKPDKPDKPGRGRP